jgi:glutamyl-tRNA synthetase
MSQAVRVRFAPSPTGYLHVGSLRTALYNYLFARKQGGVFVLRIEDTDRTRYVPGATENLIAALAWAGLGYDEGPEVGGPHEPYFQSKRRPLYLAAVERLLAAGHAYPCFCTAERLDAMRKAAAEKKLSTKYDRACLQLSGRGVEEKKAAGIPHVIRLFCPDEPVTVHDLVRGEVEFAPEVMDDQVLLKSDGYPTYHLANAVDDHEMRITHVIRGEEWLSSTPKHVLLYRFLGYEAPQFAHLPLLLNPDRSKLSKRQGDVAVEDYRDRGYLPAALNNFVAFLGWNPGDDREIFTLEELTETFSLERVNKSGAIFNIDKLKWYQQTWMRRRSEASILAELRPLLQARGWGAFPDNYCLKMIGLMRERVEFVRDYPDAAAWFFEDPEAYDPATVQKRWKTGSSDLCRGLIPVLEELPSFDTDGLHRAVQARAEQAGLKLGDLVHPLRLACTGVGGGPGLFELMEVLGRETCLRRIRRAIDALE